MLAMEVIKTGCGYPAFMNDEVAQTFLKHQYGPEGLDYQDARSWAIGGCLETSACVWKPLHLNGKEYWIPGGAGQPTSVGVHFISMPKVLELTTQQRPGSQDRRTGLHSAQPAPGYLRRALGTIQALLAGNRAWSLIFAIISSTTSGARTTWAVFHSMLKPDCLDKGHLINELGYRFNASFNVESAGTANLVNSLAALKKLVYEDKVISSGGDERSAGGQFRIQDRPRNQLLFPGRPGKERGRHR